MSAFTGRLSTLGKTAIRKATLYMLAVGAMVPFSYDANAQSPVLDDYLSTQTTDVWHASVYDDGLPRQDSK